VCFFFNFVYRRLGRLKKDKTSAGHRLHHLGGEGSADEEVAEKWAEQLKKED
jgi:hypothetical protein